MNPASPDEARLARWREAWPQALARWSRFTRLHDARLCETSVEAAREGLTGSFAMIRLTDKSVVIDLEATARLGLDDYAVEILAHEIGHHVLAPATAADSFRLIARLRAALPTLERHAPMVANLYTDLLINDRLQRQAGLRMADVYVRLRSAETAPPSRLWRLYMGVYEALWGLAKGALGGPRGDAEMEGDAWLGARVVRVYAGDWLLGAGRFASLVLPYLVEDAERDGALRSWHDTRTAAEGADPGGALTVEADEGQGAVHPSRDPRITGVEGEGDAGMEAPPDGKPVASDRTGQAREPFEYGELLRAAGVILSDEAIASRYYRERALPHLVRFPSRPAPLSDEEQMEGLETWDLGDGIEEVDWLGSVTRSPQVAPGLTTLKRVYGPDPARVRKLEPIDLDIYVDSSGSMPNPRQRTSYPTLAGAVIALSALRAGARVKATLWSGKAQVLATQGFVRDETAILNVLTGFFGGATAFPIPTLRETFAPRRVQDRPVHILVISDDGVTTMFAPDERGRQRLGRRRHGAGPRPGGRHPGAEPQRLVPVASFPGAHRPGAGRTRAGLGDRQRRATGRPCGVRPPLQPAALRRSGRPGPRGMSADRPGPPLERLTRRLAEAPVEFTAEPRIAGAGTLAVAALVNDLLDGSGAGLDGADLQRFTGSDRRADRNRLMLTALAVWLLGDAWFVDERPGRDALLGLLDGTAAALADTAPSAAFIRDPDRREELARTALMALGAVPQGETSAQAADRLSAVSAAERVRLLAASRQAEERARTVREALARKAAQEAADKWTRE